MYQNRGGDAWYRIVHGIGEDDPVAQRVTRKAARESFDDYYLRDYTAIVRLGYVLTGKRSVAEEIAQEAFLAAYRRWDRVADYRSPEAWVRRVTVNRCISMARRAATEARLVARLRRERAPEPVIGDEHQELWRLVRKLPRRQAQTVALVYLEDLAVDDVAVILGCGPETVRTHLRRAKATLAGKLDPSGDIRNLEGAND